MKNSMCVDEVGGVVLRIAGMALALLMLLGAAACSVSQAEKNRAETLKQYESIIRWSQWDAAANFIAPEYLEQHPISRLEMDRLRLFRVTQYTLRSTSILDEGKTMMQSVEIRLFNTNQAVERTIIDEQVWRYDPATQNWRLYSGLPDPTRH